MAETPPGIEPGAMSVVLGSSSPRREALLHRLGVPFIVRICDVDEESLVDQSSTHTSATRVARAKFDAIATTISVDPASVLITADTLVACDDLVLGKPHDVAHAEQILGSISGRWLQIVTAVCAGRIGHDPVCRPVETNVKLRALSRLEVRAYLATGQAFDKAGALALQGAAGGFVDRFEGCWSNVVGLPLCAVAELLDLEPLGIVASDRCSVDLCGAHGQHETD